MSGIAYLHVHPAGDTIVHEVTDECRADLNSSRPKRKTGFAGWLSTTASTAASSGWPPREASRRPGKGAVSGYRSPQDREMMSR